MMEIFGVIDNGMVVIQAANGMGTPAMMPKFPRVGYAKGCEWRDDRTGKVYVNCGNRKAPSWKEKKPPEEKKEPTDAA